MTTVLLFFVLRIYLCFCTLMLVDSRLIESIAQFSVSNKLKQSLADQTAGFFRHLKDQLANKDENADYLLLSKAHQFEFKAKLAYEHLLSESIFVNFSHVS